MDKLVYRYRSATGLFVAIFFLVWSSGWLFGLGASLLSGHIKLNGRDQSLDQASGFIFTMACLGAIGLSISLRFFLGWINDRIEIRGTEVQWWSWAGINRDKIDLSEIRAVNEIVNWANQTQLIIATDRAKFVVRRSIDRYYDLKYRLSLAAQGKTLAALEPLPLVPLSRVPAVVEETYRYRYSFLHFFSFVWTVFCVVFVGAGLVGLLSSKGPQGAAAVLFLIVSLAFLSLGIWLQMTGWNESIQIDSQRIRWIDFRKRLRVDAPLESILGMTEINGKSSMLKIETATGTVHASSNLRGYGRLKAQVQAVLNAK